MTLLLFAQTMFGNMIVIRILRRFRDRSLISTTSLTKIGTAFALLISFGAIFLIPRAEFLLLALIVCAVVLQLLLKVRENRRIEILVDRFPQFLDRWLLNLRTGSANTSARERALISSDDQFRALIKPLFDAVSTNEHPARVDSAHLFLTAHIVHELRAIHSQSHNTVPRLQNLRKSLARESAFRRKSGQALRQASIQSSVLVLMHLALCVFTAFRCGFWACADLIAVSTLLTVAGMVILRLLARRIRWTI